jgi:hypothetical protein
LVTQALINIPELYDGIEWDEQGAREFWVASKGKKPIPQDRRDRIKREQHENSLNYRLISLANGNAQRYTPYMALQQMHGKRQIATRKWQLPEAYSDPEGDSK